jgi:hypothetical protein
MTNRQIADNTLFFRRGVMSFNYSHSFIFVFVYLSFSIFN